jgi:AcrR family transcriptional regulator
MPARTRLRSGRGGDAPRARVVEIQRARLLAAALGSVEELGYARTTVAHITSRARVSRRTFYDLFANREECLLAALESVVELIRSELSDASLDALPWRERVRTGLWMILSFFDREPALARACVVQALRGGPRVLERREHVLAELARVLDEGRAASAKGSAYPPLTAEGLAGAAFTIVYGRLLRGDREPLTGLHGELMGLIVLPYLGPAIAARERSRRALSPVSHPAGASSTATVGVVDDGDLLAGVPMRLTYRTALVLETIAADPGINNRLAGERAGVADQGQISKLLSRLERLGLLENVGEGHSKGEPNAWTLTPTGARVAQSLRVPSHGEVV